MGNWFCTPRCTRFYSSYKWITVDAPEVGLAQSVQSLTHLRNLCFELVPVATRRSSQRIPVCPPPLRSRNVRLL